jgi:hypothetical protein
VSLISLSRSPNGTVTINHNPLGGHGDIRF